MAKRSHGRICQLRSPDWPKSLIWHQMGQKRIGAIQISETCTPFIC